MGKFANEDGKNAAALIRYEPIPVDQFKGYCDTRRRKRGVMLTDLIPKFFFYDKKMQERSMTVRRVAWTNLNRDKIKSDSSVPGIQGI